MKTKFISATILATLMLSGHKLEASPVVTKMGNGLTVIVQEDHTNPLVAVDVWVKAGSSNENEKNNGVSHFIEHLLFSATSKREPGDMDLEMESVGATLDAHTSRDWAHFNTTVGTRYLAKALDILSDAVFTPQFRESDVEQERLIILDELAKKEADPFKTCRDLLAKEIYGTHPYSLPIEGTTDSVKKITQSNIADYHSKYYSRKNMAVVLVGDIDTQHALDMLGQAFQGLSKNTETPAVKQEVSYPKSQVIQSIKKPFALDYVAIGFIGPSGNDYSDVCATDVLLAHLGYGYRSWIQDELKGKLGLAINSSTDFLTQNQPGLISLIASTKSSDVDRVKSAILDKISSIRKDGISENSIEVAKRSLLGDFAFQNETFGGRANSYGFYYAVSDPTFSDRYISCVQSVTNDDIKRVALKYLDPDKSAILTVGPNHGGKN